MSAVFISYSRQDKDFVSYLQQQLVAAGRDVWVDLKDIPPTADWLQEIYAGIEGSDAFLCILSPTSVGSPVCADELAYALKSKKRIVPVLRADVNPHEVNPEVAALNWIPFRPQDNAETALQQVLFALDTDLDYWHKASEIQVRARQWENKGYGSSFTLRGGELTEAERWLAEGADKLPSPSALQTRFITASRRAASGRLRVISIALSVGLIITLALSIFSTVQYQTAQRENHQLLARSLAGASAAALDSGDISQSLLLAVEASQRENSFVTRNALFSALDRNPSLDTVLQDGPDAQHPSEYGTRVEYTQDGETLMVVTSSGHITLWDVNTTWVRTQIAYGCAQSDPKVSSSLWDAALSPDGSVVATIGYRCGQNDVELWDAATGRERGTLTGSQLDYSSGVYPHTLVFSPDGSMLAAPNCVDIACLNVAIFVWSVASGEVLQRIPASITDGAPFLAFSPDSESIAVGDTEQASLWNLATQTSAPIYTSPNEFSGVPYEQLYALAFSPNGGEVAAAGIRCDPQADCNGAILFYNVVTKKVTLATAQSRNAIKSLSYSSDGSWLVATSGNDLQMWDTYSQRPSDMPLLSGHIAAVNDVAFSPDGAHIASVGADDKALVWLSPSQGRLSLNPLEYAPTYHTNLLIAPDHVEMVATYYYFSADPSALVFDLTTANQIGDYQLPFLPTDPLVYSPDSKVVARPNDGEVALWDPFTGAVVGQPFTLPNAAVQGNFQPALQWLAFSPNGEYLGDQVTSGAIVAPAHTSLVWNLATRQLLTLVPPNTNALAFSPDSKQIALAMRGGAAHAITIWDLATGHQTRTLTGDTADVQSLAYSPDGKLLATVDDAATATIWNLGTGQPLVRFTAATSAQLGRYQVAFNSDGKLLLVADGHTITLWDVPDNQLYVQTITEPAGFKSAAFSPDGRLLLDAGRSETLGLRMVNVSDWRTLACSIANRNLTRQEWATYVGSEPYHATCPGLPAPN